VLVPVLAAIPTSPPAMPACRTRRWGEETHLGAKASRQRQDKPKIDLELLERVVPRLRQGDQAQVDPDQRERCQRPGYQRLRERATDLLSDGRL